LSKYQWLTRKKRSQKKARRRSDRGLLRARYMCLNAPDDGQENGPLCERAATGLSTRARCDGSIWMVAVTRGTWPTTRVVWPCPVWSSAIFISPGPRRWIVPSRRPMSAAPDRVMTYCRRGAVCQSRNVPGGVERNTTPVAPWRVVHSGWDARSSSSMCDSPSSPVYKRTMPIEKPSPGIVV
jgi:hypothetical protein